jgi:hypothetical protein
MRSNEIGRPRYEAASIRIGTAGRSSRAPVHAKRWSAKVGGFQSGAAGVHRAGSRPAAAKTGDQSAAAGTGSGGDFSICGGTIRRLVSLLGDVVNTAHAGVRDLARDADLGVEPLEPDGVVGKPARQKLQGDGRFESDFPAHGRL